MPFNALIVILASGLLAACASQSFQAEHPASEKVTTKTTVNKGFDEAWEVLVGQLSQSFFVINNIEKESRIINVSFSTDTPRNFVDCGTGIITVNEQTHRIPYTDDATYPWVYQQGIYKYVGSARRQTSLNGRVNIYMRPISESQTEVSANAKYVMEINVKRFTNTGAQYQSDATSVTFQSNSPGQQGQMKCVSTGDLEQRIIRMAKG